MAREYRILVSQSENRERALRLLTTSPYRKVATQTFQEGEIWLSADAQSPYPDIRIFPEAYGFFVEVTRYTSEMEKWLEEWIAQLCSSGTLSIIDNDTDEVVDRLRD